MRLAAAILAIFLLAPAASGQFIRENSPPPSPQRPTHWTPEQLCTVEGTLLNSITGEPVKKVIVSVYPAGGPGQQQNQGAMTDDSGQFNLRGVEPGKYFMSAGGRGYPFQVYGQPSQGGRGKLLSFDPGCHIKDLAFKLAPGAVIAGTVYDEDGDPVVGANVQAFRLEDRSHFRGAMGGGQTNDLGEYRLYGLEAGKYYLGAQYQDPGQSEVTNNVYLPTYYPGTTDSAQASPVEVRPGDEMDAINIIMTRVHGFDVRGQVAHQGKIEDGAMYVQLMPRGSGNPFGNRNYGGQVQAETGDFDIKDVPPGSYVAFVNWNDGKTHLFGRASVEVGNADVDNVVLVPSPPFDIRGRVRADPGGQLDFSRLNIWLQPAGNQAIGGSGGRVKADGTFVLHDLVNGDYKLHVGGYPEEYYLKSALYGGSDVLVPGLTLSGAQPAGSLELDMSPNGGTISGTVLHDQKPVPHALVVLVPDPPNRGRDEMYSSKTTDDFGNFTLLGLPPGDFKLFAWESGKDADFRDPGFLSQFENRGKAVHIQEKQQQTVQLDLITAEEEAK